jgi:hypothetical protein
MDDEDEDDEYERIVLPRTQKLKDEISDKEISALRGEVDRRGDRGKVPEFTLLKNKV